MSADENKAFIRRYITAISGEAKTDPLLSQLLGTLPKD
jgi:hypothetical protein